MPLGENLDSNLSRDVVSGKVEMVQHRSVRDGCGVAEKIYGLIKRHRAESAIHYPFNIRDISSAGRAAGS